MNRRQFLLGATTVAGVGAFAKANVDEVPEIPGAPPIAPESNIRSGNSSVSTETKDSGEFQEIEFSKIGEIMKWRWDASRDEHSGNPNDYEGWAMAQVKNTHEKTLDFKVKWTPFHKKGEALKTHGEKNTIKPLEYKKFTEDWPGDNSTKYVNRLRVEVLVSDQAWFNGWETILHKEYEF